MSTVTCVVCGSSRPAFPAFMVGWLSARGQWWCPLHSHSVRVEPTAMDALREARRTQPSIQLDLVCLCGSSACEHAEDGTLLGCVDCGYEVKAG